LEWLLLTSLPITDLTRARCAVAWYSCRPLAEDYHQCLKTGCRVEQRQLDEGDDILRLLGFLAPIAVRLLQLRQAARDNPEAPASTVAPPPLVKVMARRLGLAPQNMTAVQFWQGVARLGGYLGRRWDGPPGWRTIWSGWLELTRLAEGAMLFVDLNAN
jgi:hypothetical protein